MFILWFMKHNIPTVLANVSRLICQSKMANIISAKHKHASIMNIRAFDLISALLEHTGLFSHYDNFVAVEACIYRRQKQL